MGLVFPTIEWCDKYQEALNGSESYEEAAKTWEGDFIFIITPEGGLKEEVKLYVDLWHGKCREIHVIKEDEDINAEFTITAPYSNWIKVIKGEIDPIKAILTRKLRLKGSASKIMRYTKAAKELVNATTLFDTEFME